MTPKDLIDAFVAAGIAFEVADDALHDAEERKTEMRRQLDEARKNLEALVGQGESKAFVYEGQVVILTNDRSAWDSNYRTSITILPVEHPSE